MPRGGRPHDTPTVDDGRAQAPNSWKRGDRIIMMREIRNIFQTDTHSTSRRKYDIRAANGGLGEDGASLTTKDRRVTAAPLPKGLQQTLSVLRVKSETDWIIESQAFRT